MTATEDIFARPPRSGRRRNPAPPLVALHKKAHILCAVCLRPSQIPTDRAARLCDLCIEDLDKSRAHVAGCVADTLAQLDTNQAAWEYALHISPAAERWAKVQAAMIGVAEGKIAQETFDRQWAARKAEGGALAELMDAHEAYVETCDRIQARLDELYRATGEINTAWLDKEGAI